MLGQYNNIINNLQETLYQTILQKTRVFLFKEILRTYGTLT